MQSPARYSCKVLMKTEFSKQLSKNIPISNVMKIRPVVAELSMRTDGHT